MPDDSRKSDWEELNGEVQRIWNANAEWWDDRIGDGNDFQDQLIEPATERLLEVGMVPRWQVFLTKPGMPELPALIDLIACLRLRERVAELGAQFVVFCHPPGISGEAWNMQEFAITE